MSRAWIRKPAFVPSNVDITDFQRIFFYPLLRLETGLVVKAKVPGGKALIKGSKFTNLADGPQAAVHAHVKGTGAHIHCVNCFHPSNQNAQAETVSHTNIVSTFQGNWRGTPKIVVIQLLCVQLCVYRRMSILSFTAETIEISKGSGWISEGAMKFPPPI